MKFLLSLFLLLCLALAGAGFAGYTFWTQPGPHRQEDVLLELVPGQPFARFATELERAGVVKSALGLRLGARLLHQDSLVKAGTYRFTPGLSPEQLLAKIVAGASELEEFGIPEGLNMYEVAQRLAARFPHVDKAEWLRLAKDRSWSEHLPPEAKTLEGYLFPETYRIRPHAQAKEILGAMLDRFSKQDLYLLKEEGERLGLSLHQVVTLASIIEKETGLPEERPLISSVFHNRLKRGMRLQTDPTVIYGIWERWDGNIRKRDLQTATPYNTYAIDGLPPGPIANPGWSALLAAVQPVESDKLYFVSRGDGGHVFSATFEEHNRAVTQFQLRPRAPKPPAKRIPPTPLP